MMILIQELIKMFKRITITIAKRNGKEKKKKRKDNKKEKNLKEKEKKWLPV